MTNAGSIMWERPFSTWYQVRGKQGLLRIDVLRAPQFVGYVSSRGMMPYNEDRLSLGFLSLNINGHPRPVFNASVFDGHGGSGCAEMLSQRLASSVESVDPSIGLKSLFTEYKRRFGGYWRRPQKVNTQCNLIEPRSDDLELRLPIAHLQTDLECLGADKMSGSTCTSVYIYATNPNQTYWSSKTDVNVVVAQTGDSRAIISDSSGNSLRLSTVHHANSGHESDRLARFQHVFNSTPDGQRRLLQYVNTRAFGDHQGKPFGLTPEPDLTEYLVGHHRGKLPGDEAFVVLCTDGVTDKASDQEICDIVIQQAVKGGSLRGTPQEGAAEIVTYVEMLGTRDNATAVVVRLGGWGEWSNWRDRSGSLREQKLKMSLRRQ